MKTRFFSMALAILFSVAQAFAAVTQEYYSSVEGKSGANLFDAISSCAAVGFKSIGYNNLYSAYKQTDNLNGEVWDMYSNCGYAFSNTCGNYSVECDCYNREHSVPQSWFGSGNMKSDLFNVYPTDGKVNGQRSNYPYGECASGKSAGSKALGKLGSSTFSGYSGQVFEPDNQYKGDLARSAFYCATAYANNASGWGYTFGSASGLSAYGVSLFMKWHRNDGVSEKEVNRNDAVYAKQKNRNPFIDHPELAEHIWGDKKNQAWYSNSTAIENVAFQTLELYPNPAGEYVTVTAESSELTYTILTLSGQTLAQGSVASGASIALGGLQNGLYLLRLEADGKRQVEKLMVNK